MLARFQIGIISSLVLSISIIGIPGAESRSQWEIQHPTLPPQQDGTFMPGQVPGQLRSDIPQALTTPSGLSKNFWQGQHPGFVNRVQPGVMLTGYLEQELSSNESKPGDAFSINLEDGFVQNGMQVIPQKSKIVGSVTSVAPAKYQRHGAPGSMQVSLQALVLPDGTHLPFFGFIASNPNHSYDKPPKKKNLGFDIKDTGSQVGRMMGSFTGVLGYRYARKYRGNDFYMDEGDALPIRLNRTLTMPESVVKPVAQAVPQGMMPPGMIPGAVPGLSGQDSVGQYQAPRPPQAVPGLVGESDPFTVPIAPPVSKPLSEMPEPF